MDQDLGFLDHVSGIPSEDDIALLKRRELSEWPLKPLALPLLLLVIAGIVKQSLLFFPEPNGALELLVRAAAIGHFFFAFAPYCF